MKKIWIVVIVIIFVIFLDIMTENYTNKIVSNIEIELKRIDKDLEKAFVDGEFLFSKEDEKNIEKQAEDLLKLWRKQEDMLSFYIEHDEIEKVSDKVNLLNKQIEMENYTDAISSIIEAKFLLKHITEKQSLTLKNIF